MSYCCREERESVPFKGVEQRTRLHMDERVLRLDVSCSDRSHRESGSVRRGLEQLPVASRVERRSRWHGRRGLESKARTLMVGCGEGAVTTMQRQAAATCSSKLRQAEQACSGKQ
jgi:hypothetical protein